jgi:hypothetical protein
MYTAEFCLKIRHGRGPVEDSKNIKEEQKSIKIDLRETDNESVTY